MKLRLQIEGVFIRKARCNISMGRLQVVYDTKVLFQGPNLVDLFMESSSLSSSDSCNAEKFGATDFAGFVAARFRRFLLLADVCLELSCSNFRRSMSATICENERKRTSA
jgi:hypothetical protein